MVYIKYPVQYVHMILMNSSRRPEMICSDTDRGGEPLTSRAPNRHGGAVMSCRLSIVSAYILYLTLFDIVAPLYQQRRSVRARRRMSGNEDDVLSCWGDHILSWKAWQQDYPVLLHCTPRKTTKEFTVTLGTWSTPSKDKFFPRILFPLAYINYQFTIFSFVFGWIGGVANNVRSLVFWLETDVNMLIRQNSHLTFYESDDLLS